MSQQPNLTINFSPEQSARVSEELLLVEQAEWRPYTGYVTKGNMVRYLANLLYGEAYQAQIDCGLTGGQVVAAIHVYPLRGDVQYQLLTTHGVLSEPVLEESEQEETLHFNLELTAGLRYPASRVLSTEWLSSYAADGTPATKPAVTVDGREITAAALVYGSLLVRYVANRSTHLLTLDKREDATENFYSAFVVGLPVGGRPVFLEFEPPPTAEEMAQGGYDCGMGSGGDPQVTEIEHPLDPPEASSHQRTILIDYCTQEVLMDSII